MKLSDAYEITGKHGITLVDGHETLYNMGDDFIEKLGYTNLKDMYATILGQDRSMVNTINDFEKMMYDFSEITSEMSMDEILAKYLTEENICM